VTVLPLYRHSDESHEPTTSANYGLFFDKFADHWERDGDTWVKNVDERTAFLTRIRKDLEELRNASALADMLEDHHRRRRLLATRLRGRVLQGRVRWRLTAGHGASHPLEFGFTWHRTLGVPYVPGSSVKGMVRAMASPEVPWGDCFSSERVSELFGSQTSIGSLLLLDAIPVQVPKMELDVMTPHHGRYYTDEGEIPGDYHQPTPLPFLTVAHAEVFEFIILARNPMAQGAGSALSEGISLLSEGLQLLGLGAKTAVGYGVFESVKDVTSEVCDSTGDDQQQLISLAGGAEELAPEAEEVRRLQIELQEGRTDADRTLQAMAGFFKQLPGVTDSEARRQMAEGLRDLMKQLDRWEGKQSPRMTKRRRILERILGQE